MALFPSRGRSVASLADAGIKKNCAKEEIETAGAEDLPFVRRGPARCIHWFWNAKTITSSQFFAKSPAT
jgi:hypothetical protein